MGDSDRERQHWADRAAALDPMTAVHNVLDFVGLFDPTPLSDGVNAALYAVEGDMKNAAISLAGALLPYAGDLLKVSKIGEKIVARATKLADGVSAAANIERKLVSRSFSAGIHGTAGAVTGATLGAMSGFVTGAIEGGSWGSAWEGAWNGAKFGALQGGLGGAVRGFINPYICFVAGTQVVVDIEGDSLTEMADLTQQPLSARHGTLLRLTLDSESTGVATRARYQTTPIEELVAHGGGEMGDGGGQTLLTRDQHDPDGPLVRRRILHTYERIAYHLRVLTLRDAAGRGQTQRVTDEHPYFRLGDAGWTPARLLATGDIVRGERGMLTVMSNFGEPHPQGVKVYNLEVEHDHTY